MQIPEAAPRCRSHRFFSTLEHDVHHRRTALPGREGAIGPQRGPAKAMAAFHAGAIAYATDFDDAGVAAPMCFKCKKATVEPLIAQDDAIYWSCPHCKAEGRISHWQGTLWDISERGDPHA